MIWSAVLLLILCSGAVSACETALFSLSRKTLREFDQAGGLKRRTARLMRHPRSVLMTILIANTATNISVYALSYVALEKLRESHPGAAAAAGIGVLILVILLGEVAPKGVALAHAKLLAGPSAGAISLLQVFLAPLQWTLSTLLVNPITRLLSPSRRVPETLSTDELRLLVEHSAREGHIDTWENDMLQAIVGLGEVSVRDVMTPRVDIESVRLSDDPEVVLAKVKATHKRVYPVCGRDLDDVLGVILARDILLAPGTTVRRLLRPVDFVPEQINLAQLMRHFRHRRSHFAIVVDEFGGTAGLVTNEDAVEWIVGDLPDEGAEAPPATERIDENTYRLSGDLSVREWADRFGVAEIDPQIDTVGGLILARLGRLAQVGDSIRVRNLTLTVESVARRRIERVVLHRVASASGEGEGGSSS